MKFQNTTNLNLKKKKNQKIESKELIAIFDY